MEFSFVDDIYTETARATDPLFGWRKEGPWVDDAKKIIWQMKEDKRKEKEKKEIKKRRKRLNIECRRY